MQSILDLDTETYCETPIRDGVYRYAQSVELLLLVWSIDGGPVSVVDEVSGAPRSSELREALADPHVLVRAHNSQFDRTVLRRTGTEIAIPRWRDTMVQALAHGLPGALATLCDILRVPADQAKQKQGRQLMLLFCKPRPKNNALSRATAATHPADWTRFIEYAHSDVLAMQAIAARLPAWNYPDNERELTLWHLDQTINDRGVAVDTDFARAVVSTVARKQKQLAARTDDVTKGAVASPTQRDVLLAHILQAYGVALPDMRKATLERRVNDLELPAVVRELLAIRLEAATSSTAKYATLLRAVNDDNRLRGALQFAGARRTARWAGRVFQPQNSPRPAFDQLAIDTAITAFRADCADLVYT